MRALKNSVVFVCTAAAMTCLTACNGGGDWTGSVSVVVDSDSHWNSDPWNSWRRSSGDDRRASERVGPGTGNSSGCDMVRDSSGRIRSTCPGGRLASTFTPAPGSSLAIAADSRAKRTAQKYAIPVESAELLQGLLDGAKLNNINLFSAVGVSQAEGINIIAGGSISDSTLDRIAHKLALSRTMTHELIKTIVVETKAQMADVGSPAWEACMETGKWKTNANGGICKSLAWQGCAPVTGASFCAPVR